ncbi:MAG: hypothetical protein SFX73_06015 [Kofleriaceae bacterium]|nr:hypothetical protein [Kofleriaceae bacterium]
MSLRLACAFVAVAIGTLATAAPRTRGKVVRVERARGGTGVPKICEIRTDRGGTCFGSAPAIGDVVSVIDESGVIAEARISRVSAYSARTAMPCEVIWEISTELLRGNLATMNTQSVGLVDNAVHPTRARMLARENFPPSPTGRAEDVVARAIDRDGDRQPDLIITQSQCDDLSAGAGCIDQWVRAGGKLTRVQQITFASCGI